MGSAAYSAAVLASSPRAYWKCQEASGFPQDSSGNGLNMDTVDGTPGYRVAGPLGDFAIQFNGGARFRRAASLVSTSVDNLSVELWFNPTVIAANTQPVAAWNSNADGFQCCVNSNRKFDVVVQTVGTTSESATAITLSAWTYIVIVRSAGTWKYYVNGISDTANAGTQTPLTPTGQSFFPGGNSLQSSVAHVAYYETALSAGTVSSHYAAATGTGSPPRRRRRR